MSKTVKIVIAIVVILVVLVILYYVFSGGSSAAVKKAKSGKYGKWSDGSPDWGAFVAKSISLFGKTPDIGVEGGKPQAQASGYLRGMDVARSAENLVAFETEIKAYIASGGKVDWEQTTGALLK